MSPLFDIDTIYKHDSLFTIENEIKSYIKKLPVPKTQQEGVSQFRKLYEMVPIQEWLESELVFDLGNFIMRFRPDLLSLGIRLNVQVNLFLRSIKKYSKNPSDILENVGHSIGCFALTEENAGVLSGLIVETTWEQNTETGEYIITTHENSKKNWISQGLTSAYAIVYASNKNDSSDIRIFFIDLNLNDIVTNSINILPVNESLDMAKIKFDHLHIPSSCCLENSIEMSKLELLNGIFFGRYMIAEATISAMLGQIEHIKDNINDSLKATEKFEKIGFLQYVNKCYDEFYQYKCYLYLERKSLLHENTERSLFLTNCYKIHAVEKSIEVFNKLQLMFGMRAATSNLKFENLLLHKVAEGDTYVLRISLINNHFKEGWFHMFTKAGFTIKDLYTLYLKETKREKMEYIIENFKDISDNIIESSIPLLNC